MTAGVELVAHDPDEAVSSAWVFLPSDAARFAEQQPTLANGETAVLRDVPEVPSNAPNGSFDVVVLYRTGPFCGHPPRVAVSVAGDALHIDIESAVTGNCEAMEYDEAVGLRLRPEYRTYEVTAIHISG